jgi:hypothetical protein
MHNYEADTPPESLVRMMKQLRHILDYALEARVKRIKISIEALSKQPEVVVRKGRGRKAQSTAASTDNASRPTTSSPSSSQGASKRMRTGGGGQ